MSRLCKSRLTRLAVYLRSDFCCCTCGLRFDVPDGYDGKRALSFRWVGGFQILELDHIVPYVLGGTTAQDNLQALCTSCNARKGATG